LEKLKKKFNTVDSIPGIPRELLLFRNHLKDLTLDDIPNYGYLRKLLQGALTNAGGSENSIMGWEQKPLHSKFGIIPKPSTASISVSTGGIFSPKVTTPTKIKIKQSNSSGSLVKSESDTNLASSGQSKFLSQFANVQGANTDEEEVNANSGSEDEKKNDSIVSKSNEQTPTKTRTAVVDNIDFGPDTEGSLSCEEKTDSARGKNDSKDEKIQILTEGSEIPEEDKKCCILF